MMVYGGVCWLCKIPDELASLTKLRYVNLAGCQGLKAIPNALANAWLELREIDIRSGAKKEKCKVGRPPRL